MALTDEDLKARQRALDAGKRRYIRPSDGQSWDIRNLGNPRLRHRYGGQGGSDETTEKRRGNRGNYGVDVRQQKIEKLTPNQAIQREANRKIGRLNSQNLEGHHTNQLDYASRGYDEIAARDGKAAADAWVEKQTRIGNPVDHSPDNIEGLSKQAHKEYHQQDPRQKAIKAAKGSYKGLNIRPGGLPKLVRQGFRGSTLSLALDIVEAVDAQTNGAINNTINNGVNYLRNGIENGVNGFVERYQNGLNNIADVAVKNGLFGLPTLSIDGQPDYGQKGL